MDANQVAELIRAGLPAAEKVEVTGGEGKFEALVVSPQFAGMNAVKKHQTVYATVREQIDSGELHALSIRAFTPEDAPNA
ncbi:BolA family protein [Thioalkalivibrio sp. ALM2T]|uniref:BolA family protein n=1 Tax=Thioalkalivibrio sp. ALM2T TaxID=1158184 RepID=UPI000372FD10|nr:BolA/IbaG family iron-sulfur metabolism protein [Thioalkalivibrio sp. ALM2T]